MTTANTENEDLDGLVKPKKAPLRPTGPVHHTGVPVIDIDVEDGDQTDIPVAGQDGPVIVAGGEQTDGPVHHTGGPVDSSGGTPTQPDSQPTTQP
ncbi:hypothetical protein [Kibdelosporangium aridum]|uniref:Uncharacterized protein n=1 Tax=Kibdelosporangium aridum TaxID=2030 RepID=A0A1Y5XE62_KIBAR|nr:hypothetical protein [Kibdelosporangium aridum]SMC89003.1 hypothetical protein SAMN05661093_02492 [Kibdelosporangium aridum]